MRCLQAVELTYTKLAALLQATEGSDSVRMYSIFYVRSPMSLFSPKGLQRAEAGLGAGARDAGDAVRVPLLGAAGVRV